MHKYIFYICSANESVSKENPCFVHLYFQTPFEMIEPLFFKQNIYKQHILKSLIDHFIQQERKMTYI